MFQIQRSPACAAVHRRCAPEWAVLLAAFCVLIGGCKKGESNAYAPPPPPEVIVAHPVERDVQTYLTYTGTIESSETVELRARVQGFLEKMNFQPGQRVKKGDLLFTIDKREFQAAVDRANAQIQALQSSLEGAENDARLARELADQHAGPEIDALIKSAKRDSIKGEVARAQGALVDAKLNLEFCEVTAPIDGRITANQVDVGNLVGRGQPTLLATIVQSVPSYVNVDVSESDVLAIRRELEKSGELGKNEPGQIGPGQWRPCELALADRTNFDVPGRVDYVEPRMNTETGTLRVRTRYDNTDEKLLAGYFGRVRFPMSSRKAMLVPEAALLSDQQGRYAVVVNAKDEVEVKRVTIAELDGKMRVVQEGLTVEDRVIVLGVLKARPGAKVTPKTQDKTQEASPPAEEIGMLAEFPVRRPIVAAVISILIVIMGVVAYPTLPVAQYPDITPPVIQVTASYPGASAQVVADTVAAPIEQEVNGVPGMIYMESTSASDGSYTLDVTFELGTNIDIASVLVQNRVSIAQPKLPEEVTRNGITTDKVSSSFITVFALAPKDEAAAKKYDDLFITNYITINVLDEIKRIKGVGDATIFPAKDYGIRVWLDPDRLRARGLTTMDVINALKEQNIQVAAGAIGQPPVPSGQAYQYNVSTLGRLTSVDQFENVIVRADGNRIIRVKDVARVELGGKSYDLLAAYKGTPAAVAIVYQAPGGNAVQIATEVEKLLHAKSASLPEGLSFEIVYDSSKFVVAAVDAVFHTFIEALVLVLAVVIVFLGSLRLSVIPMLAIPVSIIGTFFFAKLFGFSLNMPVLFGLVVAIGIVVDDAIVVVENVEAVMKQTHLPPKEATVKAMKEVLAPVISITVVLMAVFIPTAFLPGISGQLFKQFALTIAASTFLSGVCAVTLTPALCGFILKAHKEGHKPFILVRWFNAGFDALANGYANAIKFLVHPGVIAFTLAGFAACIVGIVWTFTKVPTGFVPLEDRGLIMVEVWMPDSASQERTVAAAEKVEAILSKTDGVKNYSRLSGYSIINDKGSNYAAMFAGLEDWDVRLPKGRDTNTIMAELRAKTAAIPDALCIVFSLPAIDGVGSASGFDLRLQDRAGVGRDAMGALVQGLVADGNAQSKLRAVNSGYRAAVPQLFADIDREKVKKLGIPLQDVFSTMSGYLASAYVNDFNLYGRTWQVNVSADSRFRATAEDIKRLDVRKPDGGMVPLGSLMSVHETMGADRVIRYNIFPAAVLQGQPAPGVSSGESLKVVESMADAKLPPGTSYEWTALSYQEKLVGGQAIVVFAMALLVVYLILAGLYESWFIPLSVIFSIPLAVLGAMAGLMYRGMDNNIYTQVGLVLLVGLGAKNAILIVEFAKAYREQGKGIVESAVEASRQRLRPILMTALAFILGVLPLMIATGAGAASRQAIGTAVFFGMIGNTFLGLIFTPILYVCIQAMTEKVFGTKPVIPAKEA